MNNFDVKLSQTKNLLQSAVRDHVFESCCVGVYHQNGDQKNYYEDCLNCAPNTLFDLASLTKVLCTTTLYAMAVDQGKINLDASLKKYFEESPSDKITLKHLLNHTSGFIAWSPFYEMVNNYFKEKSLSVSNIEKSRFARQFYEKEILKNWNKNNNTQFENECVYSDLNFMLLGWILEIHFKTYLDALFQEWVVQPTGFESLQFIPTTPDVAPTESCPWRGHILRGEVHDDNCFVLGGVAGHAGLFGTAKDVTYLGKIWLDSLLGNISLFSKKTANLFWDTSLLEGSTFKFGWDSVSSTKSSAGTKMSAEARGHLGFTGTSIWIDPQKRLIVTLLTNRVYPSRANEKIKDFRPIFHDTLLTELGF